MEPLIGLALVAVLVIAWYARHRALRRARVRGVGKRKTYAGKGETSARTELRALDADFSALGSSTDRSRQHRAPRTPGSNSRPPPTSTRAR